MPTALYNTVAALSFPVIRGLYRLSWTGLDRLPPEGGFVLAANHTSSLDPWPLVPAELDGFIVGNLAEGYPERPAPVIVPFAVRPSTG